jgi:transcriptional regulator with XRE-family HTH domain
MKRTPEDDSFAIDFGRELTVKYSRAKRRGVTDQVFAASIGVARAQLDKYLRGEAVPSVRTVALALRKHAVAVPYDKIPLQSSLDRKKRPKRTIETGQLLLPFTILSEGPEKIGVRFKPVSSRNFEVHLLVKKI